MASAQVSNQTLLLFSCLTLKYDLGSLSSIQDLYAEQCWIINSHCLDKMGCLLISCGSPTLIKKNTVVVVSTD